MLSGLMWCEQCGANYIVSSSVKRGQKISCYRCSRNANKGKAVSQIFDQFTFDGDGGKISSNFAMSMMSISVGYGIGHKHR